MNTLLRRPLRLLLFALPVLAGCTPHAEPVETRTPAPPVAARQEAPPVSDLPPPLDAQANLAPDFVASTNEPFWTVSVQGRSVVLTGIEGKRDMVLQSNESFFDGRNVIAVDAAGRVEVRVTPRACQDSMSGEGFPYTARVTVDQGAPVLGCARAK